MVEWFENKIRNVFWPIDLKSFASGVDQQAHLLAQSAVGKDDSD